MNPLLLFIYLIFAAGILTEAFILINRKLTKKLLIGTGVYLISCLIYTLTPVFIPQEINSGPYLYPVILYISLFYGGWFASTFKHQILPLIHEGILLILTTLFWFVFLKYIHTSFNPLIIAIAIIPTILVFISSFTDKILPPIFKTILYHWYLFTSSFIIVTQFSFGSLTFMHNQALLSQFNFFEIFVSGMIFIKLLVLIWYFLEFIPYSQTPRSNKEVLRERFDLLARSFGDYQLNPWYSAFILFLIVDIFAINHMFNLIPDFLIVNLILLYSPVISWNIPKIKP